MAGCLALILLFGFLEAASAQGVSADAISQSGLGSEAREALGDGVVGYAQPARPLNDPTTIAQWAPGEWRYLITAGPRRGQIERESLARVDVMTRGETWKRTVGQEYTLHLSQTSEGSLVLPSEVAHGHNAVVQFEPPLSYLIVGLAPWETRVFAGKMEVYSSSDPATKWYSGRIRTTTAHAGAYRVTTPAGTFTAVLIRTDYRIDILGVVSVTDTLHTFYAEGVGKVAETEHRRVSMGLFKTDTRVGKVLLSFTPARPAAEVQAP